MACGERLCWVEAAQILAAATPNVRAVNGCHILKLYIRWVAALVDVKLGRLPPKRARSKIGRILAALDGRGLSVHLDHADAAKVRAERSKGRATYAYELAALTSDVALFGGFGHVVSKGTREAMELLSKDAEDLRHALADLHEASEQGDDVRSLALRVRELCPGAPPLPPSLKEAA